MLKAVVGHSNDPESSFAIAEVIEQCQANLAEATPKAGILLAAIDFDHAQLLQQIHDTFPAIELIGGTTDGEFSPILGFQQDSVLLILFCSDTIEIRAGIGRDISNQPEAAIRQAIEPLISESHKPKLCLTIAEGLTTQGDVTLAALGEYLGRGTTIAGGMSGDHGKYQKTYQFFQQEVISDAVCVLLFFGNLHLSVGVDSGWQPVSKMSQITKAVNGTVYEIDHQPTVTFYQNYLGDLPPSTDYPLAVFPPESERFYIRALNYVDPNAGSINFAGNVPEQSMVQIAEASQESILSATESSIGRALAHYPNSQPALALCFPCDSRRHLLGTQTKLEYQIVQAALPSSVPCIGFYCYGEIGPLELGGQTLLHNQSFITLLLGSDEGR